MAKISLAILNLITAEGSAQMCMHWCDDFVAHAPCRITKVIENSRTLRQLCYGNYYWNIILKCDRCAVFFYNISAEWVCLWNLCSISYVIKAVKYTAPYDRNGEVKFTY